MGNAKDALSVVKGGGHIRVCDVMEDHGAVHWRFYANAAKSFLVLSCSVVATDDVVKLLQNLGEIVFCYRIGLLRKREFLAPYRQGKSTALVMPMRMPLTISGLRVRAWTEKGT